MDRQILEGFAEAIETGGRAEMDIEDDLQTLEPLFLAAEDSGRNQPAAS